MTTLKLITSLALFGVMALDASASLANDTRNPPERPPQTNPDRPPLNDPDRPPQDHGDTTAPDPERPLPKSSPGLICRLDETRTTAFALLLNDTGETIPAGSTITIFVAPGNIKKSYVLQSDWKPGEKLEVPLKGVKLADGAECAVRVKIAEPAPEQPPSDQPSQEPPQEPESPTYPDPYWAGSTGQVGTFDDPNVQMSAACLVAPEAGKVLVFNTGNVKWPVGTKFEITLPNGEVYVFETHSPYVPGGKFLIPQALVFAPDPYVPGTPLDLPADWACSIKMVLPDAQN